MRTPITLKIKFKSTNLDQFIERYSVDVSQGGIFIRTKEPLTIGTQLRFEFQLQDSTSLISGEGTVAWIRAHDPSRTGVAPGMGVRFEKLSSTSDSVLQQILQEKVKRGDSAMESRYDAGVRASSVTSGTVMPTAAAEELAPVREPSAVKEPAPPMADHSGEFGSESTRVMGRTMVQELAERSREERAKAPAAPVEENPFAQNEPTRRATLAELEAEAIKAEQGRTVKDEAPRKKVEIAGVDVPTIQVSPDVKTIEPDSDDDDFVVNAPSGPKMVDFSALREPVQAPLSRPASDELPVPRKSSLAVPLAFAAVAVMAIGYFVFGRGGTPTQEVKVETKTSVPPPVEKIAASAPPVKAPEPSVVDKPAENSPEDKPAAAVEKPSAKTEAAPEAAPQVAAVEKPPAPERVLEKVASPTKVSVPITSDPPGAAIFINGKPFSGVTPATLNELEVSKSYDVRVTMKGFQPWHVRLSPKLGDKLNAAMIPAPVAAAPVKRVHEEKSTALPKPPVEHIAEKAPEKHEAPVEKPATPPAEKPAAAAAPAETKSDAPIKVPNWVRKNQAKQDPATENAAPPQ